ncbi:serine O-acetyltransferase EpsC [Alcaligenes endophyticus]|uniref:serine O-acetyltransferase n=1 Tax=Alcaligenes endophyticus TaxID=1929088 RepID=A0ABT8EHS4_9BURK|nr:serine O-acetyltransferase EpsC [Alcaligenes endophyticus]MCX5592187.1 serine acetyltransferase [Alcaligenes endophyticus]MDN4120834.1 serine acetyltransferase [Alcaligenes endophyticus]
MNHFDISDIVNGLRLARDDWRQSQDRLRDTEGREFPSRIALNTTMEQLKGALFPMRLGSPELRRENEDYYVGYTLSKALSTLVDQACIELGRHHTVAEQVREQACIAIRSFSETLPELRRILDMDVQAAYQGDPAARSVDEVLLCYPGIVAMIHHRIAHRLYTLELPLLARIIAELAHSQTGIDIHPGAQISEACFIDHGTGVVIGETAIIGQRVRIYQAVTLGAKRFLKDEHGHLQKGQARHPIVEDDVVIYAGATILGRVTLGQGCIIGGNVWITDDVRPGQVVTQASLLQDPSKPPSYPN